MAVAAALTRSDSSPGAHLTLILSCSDWGMRETTSSTRDRGLRRLRHMTGLVLATAGALTAAFAGLAARALPGHHASPPTRAGIPAASAAKAVAPPLVAVQSVAPPAAPAAPPTQTPAPPVVVSGGT